MAVKIHVVLHGGPQPGPIEIPTYDGTPPMTLNGGHASEMAQYVLTDERDHLDRPVYRPDPMLRFKFEDPDGGGQ